MKTKRGIHAQARSRSKGKKPSLKYPSSQASSFWSYPETSSEQVLFEHYIQLIKEAYYLGRDNLPECRFEEWLIKKTGRGYRYDYKKEMDEMMKNSAKMKESIKKLRRVRW